jgi:hypothetical protein
MKEATSTDLPAVGGAFQNLFGDLKTLFTTSTDPGNPDSPAYIWGSNPRIGSFLNKLYTSVDGSDKGTRWAIYYAFQGMFTDIDTLFTTWATTIGSFWKKSFLDVLVSDTVSAIATIKALSTGTITITVSNSMGDGVPLPTGGGGNNSGGGGNNGGGGGSGNGKIFEDSNTTNNYYNIRHATITHSEESKRKLVRRAYDPA